MKTINANNRTPQETLASRSVKVLITSENKGSNTMKPSRKLAGLCRLWSMAEGKEE